MIRHNSTSIERDGSNSPTKHQSRTKNRQRNTKNEKSVDTSWVNFDSSWSAGGEGGDTEPDSTLYSNSSAESTNDENFYKRSSSRTPSPIMTREVIMRTPPPFPTKGNSDSPGSISSRKSSGSRSRVAVRSKERLIRRDSPPLHTSSSDSSAAARRTRQNRSCSPNHPREIPSRQNTSSPRSILSTSSSNSSLSPNTTRCSYKKVFPFSRSEDIHSLLGLFDLEDGKVLNKYSFLCLGSTYFENLKSGEAIRSSLLVHRGKMDFFPMRRTGRRCASPSSDTEFEGFCPPSPGDVTAIPSEINTDKQVSHLQSMAVKHLLNGSYNTSIELLEEVLLLFRETFDPGNPLTVQTLHNLGNLHLLSGNGHDYDIALHYLQDAIDINRMNNTDHDRSNTMHLVSSLVKMGIANYASHHFEHAQNCFREAITCSIPLHGPNHPRVAEIFNNLACVHYERELYTLSLKILEKALEVQKKFLSELIYCDRSLDCDRNELVIGLSIIECNIGFVYLKLKDFDKAVCALEQALSNQLLILDETDTLVMTLLDNLAFANLQRHQEEKALRTFERLLYSQVRVLGAYDIQCATTWSKMSRLYLKRHEYESALKCVERVFECHEKNEKSCQREEFKRMERTERVLQEKLELLIERKRAGSYSSIER